MPKRLEYVTKLEKFTSLTIHFSSKFDKYSILYPHLKINFLEQQFQNFQTKFGENSWSENDGNSTNLKTISNPVQKMWKITSLSSSTSIQNLSKVSSTITFENLNFLGILVFFPFSYFHQKCWVFILILVKQILFFVKFAVFWIFMKKVTGFQIGFICKLWFFFKVLYFHEFLPNSYHASVERWLFLQNCWYLLFWKQLEISSKFQKLRCFKNPAQKRLVWEHNRHIEKSC